MGVDLINWRRLETGYRVAARPVYWRGTRSPTKRAIPADRMEILEDRAC